VKFDVEIEEEQKGMSIRQKKSSTGTEVPMLLG
jgi:hypothetical protein